MSDDFLSGFESKVDRGLFFTDVKIKGKNPFDIIRSCEDGTLDKNYNDVSKIFFTIKHGDGDFKPIQEYYPALSGFDLNKLELFFFKEGKTYMTQSNSDYEESVDYKKFYAWETTYGEIMAGQTKDVEYSYKVASSIGWYLIALLVGIVVVVVLWLVRRKSKERGKERVLMTPVEMYYQMAEQNSTANQRFSKTNVFEEFKDSNKKGRVFEEFDNSSEKNKKVFEEFDNDKDN